MKILFVGNMYGAGVQYVEAFLEAAMTNQHVEADGFDEYQYFHMDNLLAKIETKISLGMRVYKTNRRLVLCCREKKYDLVFFYSCRLISEKTVASLKDMGIKIASYCNDNPFSEYYPKYFWRNWRKCVKYSDVTYVYRKSNIDDAKKCGATNVKLLRSYYMDSRNFYIPNEMNRFYGKTPHVIFLGHFEEDLRVECIRKLAKSGVSVGVNTTGQWPTLIDELSLVPLSSKPTDYNEQINAADIALVFLSKINNDTYTRRCFEIPITKTLMIAEYSDDLASIYVENEEIVFFHNSDECVEKVLYYLDNVMERQKIAENGYKKVIRNGSEAKDRVNEILKDFL